MTTTSHQQILTAAYHLLGDGNGREWTNNPEYTRAIAELVRDTCGLGIIEHDEVLGLIREKGEPRPQILPTQELDGGTVVASVYVRDDIPDPLVMALLLMPEPGRHYRIVDVHERSRNIVLRQAFENLVPAVEHYVESGGDY